MKASSTGEGDGAKNDDTKWASAAGHIAVDISERLDVEQVREQCVISQNHEQDAKANQFDVSNYPSEHCHTTLTIRRTCAKRDEQKDALSQVQVIAGDLPSRATISRGKVRLSSLLLMSALYCCATAGAGSVAVHSRNRLATSKIH